MQLCVLIFVALTLTGLAELKVFGEIVVHRLRQQCQGSRVADKRSLKIRRCIRFA